MYYSLFGILKLYAIYTPYITEAVYQDFYRKYERESSLHQTLWERKKGERGMYRRGTDYLPELTPPELSFLYKVCSKLQADVYAKGARRFAQFVVICPEAAVVIGLFGNNFKAVFEKAVMP